MMTLTKKKAANAATIVAMQWALERAQFTKAMLSKPTEDAVALRDKMAADPKTKPEELAAQVQLVRDLDVSLGTSEAWTNACLAVEARISDLAKQQARKVA